MATDKKSFILYCDLLAVVRLLPDDKAGLLFKHILQYVNDENPETDDLIVRLTFEPIKQQLKRDLSKWEKTIGKNSDAGINSALSKFKSKILANLKSVDIDFEISHCKKRISVNGGSDYYFEQCLMFLNEIQRNSTTVDSVATKSTDNVTVTDNVNDNVNEEREERAHENFEPTLIFTSQEIEIQEQRKVAPKESESEIVVYPIGEIKTRLSEWEYELIENSCKVLKITVEEYKAGVDLFLYQQGDEGMRKDYTDVKKHFRSWLKNNITNIRKSLNANGKPPEKSKTEQIIENSYKAQPIIEDYFKNRNNG